MIDAFAICFATIAVLYVLARAILLDARLPWFEGVAPQARNPDPELAMLQLSNRADEAKG
jgi:hypothetical protein